MAQTNTPRPLTATLIGATGLIGGHLLRLLQADPYFGTVRVLVRRPIGLQSPRTEEKLINFADVESFRLGLEGSDVIFVAVGTTQKKVGGDEAAYRKVDFDIPVAAARWGKEAGARHLLLVSSVGANAGSSNFYLRLKGQTEDAVKASGMEAVSVFRPSMLLGERKEARPGERIGQVASQLFSGLMMGGLRKYKPVLAELVAAAMIAQAKTGARGFHVFEYDAIRQLAGAR
ncbi:hypothetical protein EPD60_02845 [Flaviaesturariibacter flavus]|uniref:NAD(P)-binding domain-containing protein n=1 Tax=Flaviaesturariibacter flavus TaxID=2502780 RepID=A0A4R1BQ16_9BACT|nr:NAD(P)H-binding protein [Flaviaesturariibacter flavus]TCJ19367.1 hypothetical protein EPD60_02845 [Flaviaesturariibacter flavus]